jgi:hypothetical protein
MKEFYQQMKEEFLRSDTEYCYYCLEPKGDKRSCCQENHFGRFGDLDGVDQHEIIIQEYELAFGEKK